MGVPSGPTGGRRDVRPVGTAFLQRADALAFALVQYAGRYALLHPARCLCWAVLQRVKYVRPEQTDARSCAEGLQLTATATVAVSVWAAAGATGGRHGSQRHDDRQRAARHTSNVQGDAKSTG